MANGVDGQIVLGLNISQTAANIQTGIDKILNTTKTKQIVLKTAIEKAETEKSIDALVSKINKRTVNLGIEVDTKDVHSILAEQQKIASTQARLNAQMQEYRKIAQDIGITLNKRTWNEFNHAINVEDFSKAQEIIRSAKQQIDEYNKSVKRMNSDTSVSGSVSSIIDKFTQLKNVSSETQNRIYLLQADMKQFETADSTKTKLSAYNRLQTLLEKLSLEYEQLKSSEKGFVADNSIQEKYRNAQSLYTSLSQVYSSADSQAGFALKSSLDELNTALTVFDETSKGLSGGKLASEWDKVDAAIQNVNRSVKEYKAEQSAVGKIDTSLSQITVKIQQTFDSLQGKNKDSTYVTQLRSELQTLLKTASSLQEELNNLDLSDGNAVAELTNKIRQLSSTYGTLRTNMSKSLGFDNKISDAQSYLHIIEKTYSQLGKGKEAETLRNSISDLKTAIKNINKDAVGTELASEWNKVDEAVKKVVRSVREYNAQQKNTGAAALSSSYITLIDDIKSSMAMLGNEDVVISGEGTEKLKNDLSNLLNDVNKLQKNFSNLDPNKGEQLKQLEAKVVSLSAKFKVLSSDVKVFSNANEFAKFTSNVESARQKVEEYEKTYSAIKADDKLMAELDRLKQKTQEIFTPQDLKNFNSEFESFNNKVKQAGLHTQSLADKLKTAFTNFAQFFTASRILYTVFETMKDMVSNVRELDAAMIELRKVTDETDVAYTKFLTNAKKRAVELGTTVTDLVNATSDFSRLGYTMEESTKLGEIATIYANVGDDVNSIDQATTSLISTMKGFGLEVADAQSIVDKFNEVGNNFAISSGGIGDALQRSAAALKAAGNDIDQSIALIVAANNVIQDADTVGTMWKTVSMRIRGAKTELEAAGLETEYMAESTATLRDTIMGITNIDGKGGIDILTDSGAFKDTYTIILEIAQIWEKLGESDPIGQSALLELLAGKRQGNALAAVLTNIEDLVAVLETSQNASEGLGSAMEEYQQWLGGLESKIQSFKAAFESLSSTVVNSEFLKIIVDAGTNVIQIIDSVIQKMGGLVNVILSVVSIATLLNPTKTFNNVKQILDFLNNLTGISKLFSGIKSIKNTFVEAGSAGLSFGQMLKNLKGQLLGTATVASVVTSVISGLVAALTIGIAIYQQYTQKIEENRQAAEDAANAYQDTCNSVDEYKEKIKTLRDEIDKGNLSEQEAYDKRTELISIQESLIDMFGKEAEGINLVTGAIDDQIDAINRLSKAEWENYKRENTDAIDNAVDLFTTAGSGTGTEGTSAFYSTWRNSQKVKIPAESYIRQMFSEITSDTLSEDELNSLVTEYYSQLRKNLLEAIPSLEIKSADLDYGINDAFMTVGNIGDNIYEFLESYEKIYDVVSETTKAYAGVDNYGKYANKSLEQLSEKIIKIKNDIKDNEDIFNTYVQGLLAYEEKYSKVYSKALTAKQQYDDAMVSGDKSAITAAVQKMQEAEQEFLAAGWDNEAVNLYMQDFFDEFSATAEDHEIPIKIKAELSNDRSQITDAVQRAISVLKDESGKIDTYAVGNIGFTIDDTDISKMNEQQKAYLGLKAVADEYKISVTELISVLAELGYVELKQTENSQQEVSETQKTIDVYKEKYKVLQNALDEFNNTGSVTNETYNKVIALNEDYANMFSFLTGKITINTDTLSSNAEALMQEAGALLAAENATDDEIYALALLANGLRQTAKNVDVTTSTLQEYVDILAESKNGTTYNALEIYNLIEKYPDLEECIRKTANGYILEEEAIRDVIAAKADLLDMNDTEVSEEVINTYKTNPDAFIPPSTTSTETQFEKDYKKHQHMLNMNQESEAEYLSWLDGAYKEALNNKTLTLADSYKYEEEVYSGRKKLYEESFNDEYSKHQHMLNMDQESVADYLKWLNSAYKAAYDAGQIELDDYYKYQEEVYSKTQELFKDAIGDTEHKISLLDRQDGTTEEIVALYQKLQEAVHEQAEKYRAAGLDDNNSLIQELQNQWWDYYDAITAKMVESYEEIVNSSQNQITLTENLLDNAVADGNYTKVRQYSDEIIAQYRKMQETIHEEAEYYRSLGYSDTSDEVSKLSDLWWDYQANIAEAASAGFQALVDNANSALDEIQDVYSTLKDAAQEQADSGFLTVDTYQKILSLGANYLAYLTNENGQLVINEENIKKCVAARTQQVAVETALNYIQQLRTALTENDTAALQNLLYATDAATDSTWGLVYAQLAALELTDDQYNTALQRIDAIRSLADNAVTSIGQETGQIAEQANQAAETMKEQLQQTSDALDDILKYTIEMIKQEVNNQVDALKQQVKEYQNIVDLKKESLELTKEQDEYDENVADKVKDISKLEAKIQQLSLDDSREAQAEKAKLQEELAEMQNDLADYQSDYAYDATIDSLDKQAEAYEAEKEKEIAILEDSISSYEKVYQLAIDRINNQWDTLYMDLINWNTQYGSDTNEQITSAWNNASAAVQQYGNYLAAVQATQAALNAATSASSSSSFGSTTSSGSLNLGSSNDYSADAAKGRQVSNLVSKMKANSAAWWNASDEQRQALEEENTQLATQVQALLGKKLVRGADGVWYIGSVDSNDLLYEKYHEGGIVGGKPTLKDKETIAVLEKGELVLDEKQKETLHKAFSIFDQVGVDRDKFNAVMFGQNSNQVMTKMDEIGKQSMNEAMNQISTNKYVNAPNVDASVTIHGDVDGDTWKKIYPVLKDHQKQVADITCKEIMSTFSRRGIRK